MSPYPVIEKPKERFGVKEFMAAFTEYGGLLSITMAGELVERPKQQISQLVQSGRIQYLEIQGRRFVIVKSLIEWKNKLESKKNGNNFKHVGAVVA